MYSEPKATVLALTCLLQTNWAARCFASSTD
jgi:hypothetical protein